MATRKTRKTEWMPILAMGVAVGSATALWFLTRKKETPEGGLPTPERRPDGTYGTGPLDVAQGPIFPPHGRILVVGGQNAAALGFALREVMTQVEAAQPSVPAGPQMVTVWDGASPYTSVTAFAAAAEEKGIPDGAKDLGGLGPPDVIVVLVGEYDGAYGPQGDMLASASALVGKLWPLARDHLPNVIWVLPWSGKPATEFRLELAGTLLKAAPLHVLPYLPRAEQIPMADEMHPTEQGFGALAQQIAGVMLKWYQSH